MDKSYFNIFNHRIYYILRPNGIIINNKQYKEIHFQAVIKIKKMNNLLTIASVYRVPIVSIGVRES